MPIIPIHSIPGEAPAWTYFQADDAYHAASRSGKVMSSGMLREFRRSPARYRSLTTGLLQSPDSMAFRFGRAVHTLILEGEAAFRNDFRLGGPMNADTGRTYAANSKKYADWLLDNGFIGSSFLTPEEADSARRMRNSVLGVKEIAAILREGWPERSALASLEGVRCQSRMDWLCPDGTILDLKTVRRIDRYQYQAREFGYLNQFAFYREVARAAGAPEAGCFAILVEKTPPFAAALWEIPSHVLDAFASQNRYTLHQYHRCRRANRWPVRLEKERTSNLAALPPHCQN